MPEWRAAQSSYRPVAGFMVLPPSMAVLTFVSYLALGERGQRILAGGATVTDPLGAAGSLALGVGLIASLVTLAAALPLVLWLRERQRLVLSRLLLLGAALGNLPFLLIVLGIMVLQAAEGRLSPDVARFWYGTTGALRLIAIGTFHGLVGAGLFYLVAIRRPNRLTPEREESDSGAGSAI